MSGNRNLEKATLLDELDRHLEWIKSCDTKASIALAMLGIFIASVYSEPFLGLQKRIIISVFSNINFSNLIYLVLVIFAYLLFIYGTYNIIRVLLPQLKKSIKFYDELESDSLYYFESISNKTYLEYKKHKINRTLEEDFDDLLSQIYINAKIATKKYYFYRKGLLSVLCGVFGILILYFIGVVLINFGGF